MIAAMLYAATLSMHAVRAITVAPHGRPVWAILELPQSLNPGADGSYDDLRIVDDHNDETPYVLDPQCAATPARNATVSDVGFVPGRYTQALLDAGTAGTLYSGISIDTPRDTYFDRVDVAISDDRTTWRDVRNDALIYRVADSGDPGTQAISLPPARARWIRIRVLDPRAFFSVDSATLAATDSQTPQRVMLLHALGQSSSRDEYGRSIVDVDLGTPNTHISSIHFTTAQHEFSRDVSIFTSDDDEHWSFAGGGRIERFAHGTPILDVDLSQASGRYVRVKVTNGSDAPLPDLRAFVFGPRRVLVFVARRGRSYFLTRTASDEAPAYDLGTLLEHDNPQTFALAQLASGEAQHQSLQRTAISQPLILTIAFGVVIVTLGAVTLLTLRQHT
jgi:hypothetical protein